MLVLNFIQYYPRPAYDLEGKVMDLEIYIKVLRQIL